MRTGAIRHGPCPRCRKMGMDTRGDNLVLYPDGHKWCFSCHYYEAGTLRERLTNYLKPDKETSSLNFPDDYSNYIPIEGMNWLRQYHITMSELKAHKIGWSPSRKLVIFPIYDGEGRLIAWQGRNFAIEEEPVAHDDPTATRAQREKGKRYVSPKKKYLTFGNISDIMHVIEPESSTIPDTLVVVEGVLDAIKVGRIAPAMPLFGSHMALGTIIRASRRFSRLAVWLDSDKVQKAVETAIRASQYMPATVVYTPGDPKEYTENGAMQFIERALKEPVPQEGANNT